MTDFSFTDMQVVLEWFRWSPTEWMLTFLLFLSFLVQLYYYLVFFRGIPRWSKRIHSGKIDLAEKQVPVSVIITASNQREILAKHLPLFLEQDYPEFQVVVVDDASSDETGDLLKDLCLRYPHLYHTFVPPGVQSISSKKIALTVGIKAARYDYLLFTDANCEPSGNQWISSMMRQFTPDTTVVLSYSRFDEVKGVLKKLIAYDNLFQAIRYLGMAVCKKPYMGVGRNMAYRKDLFFGQRGFASHLNLHTGEDDLFISDVAKGSNTRIEASPESVIHVVSEDPKYLWKDGKFNQLQTSNYYRTSARFRTGLEIFSRYIFYGMSLTLLLLSLIHWNLPLLIVFVVFFLARFTVQVSVINSCAKILKERRFFMSVLFFDLLLPYYSLLLSFDSFFHRRKSSTRQILH
jgi:glycosyltransferase involved in cell wall biosynthesis